MHHKIHLSRVQVMEMDAAEKLAIARQRRENWYNFTMATLAFVSLMSFMTAIVVWCIGLHG